MRSRTLSATVFANVKLVKDSVMRQAHATKYANRYGSINYRAGLHCLADLPLCRKPKRGVYDQYESGGSSIFDSPFAERKRLINY